ncbi:Nuclear pore complex protein NUP58 [Zea mays]|uniref:Nuclear pore complex protein NUP58 n=1 Tax=Zea mays TaxID=4577 RepID=A0A3L6DX54_MAIZE|nr:Nuclear pore complex protein NUP58 [Zea mays]
MAFSFASPPASNPFQTPAASNPFQTPAASNPFQTPAAPNPFQTPTPATSQAPSLSPSPFQFSFQPQPQQQPQQQQVAPAVQPPQPQPQHQKLMLYTTDMKPAGYNTKWEELHAESQKALLQIEDKIRDYRDECERLDQCSRLYDSSISNVNFELDASRIVQELGGTTTVMEREKASIQELMNVVNEMMWNAEFAIRSYLMLRPRFTRTGAGVANGGSSNPSAGAPSNQPVLDFYSGVPKRPSIFMQRTVNRFECYLAECCKWIGELEQLVQIETNKISSDSLDSLPKVMSNVHDYFIYVASKLTTPFGTASTPTLASTPAPGFGTSTTSLGGTSLFSTPFGERKVEAPGTTVDVNVDAIDSLD